MTRLRRLADEAGRKRLTISSHLTPPSPQSEWMIMEKRRKVRVERCQKAGKETPYVRNC
jgi:hypothetical protein